MINRESSGLSDGIEDAMENAGQAVRPENGLPITKSGGNLNVSKIVEAPMSVAEKIVALQKFKTDQEKAETGRKAALAAARNNIIVTPEDRERKSIDMVREIAQKQIENGFPIGQDGRIKMEVYDGKDNYQGGVVGADIRGVAFKISNESVPSEFSGGKLLEMVGYALFNKFFKDRICCGASQYDDKSFDHQADLLLFDEKYSLNVAFALALKTDAVADNLEVNRDEVDKKNNYGGGKVKYCFQGHGEDMVYGPETDVPFFALDLDLETMRQVIKSFSLKEPVNDSEKMAMFHFADSLYKQIDDIEFDLGRKAIKFDRKFGDEARFRERVTNLKTLLENNFPRDEVKQYINQKFIESKGTSAKTSHKRKISRR